MTKIQIPVALILVCAASLGCRKEEPAEPVGAQSLALEGLEDDAEASQASLDASELALGGPASAFAGGPGACSATVTGEEVIEVCGRTIPGDRTVSWSCTGPGGNGVTGSATIDTTVIDATSCPSVAIRHDITFARTRTVGSLTAELEGIAEVDLVLDATNHTAQRTVAVDVTRRVEHGEDLVRNQRLTGERVADLAANAPGPDDDTRTVNGNVTIEFLLRGSQLDVGATDLLWTRACCHPVSGRLDWILSGTDEGEGSLEFGPACGDAVNGDGEAVELAACPAFE